MVILLPISRRGGGGGGGGDDIAVCLSNGSIATPESEVLQWGRSPDLPVENMYPSVDTVILTIHTNRAMTGRDGSPSELEESPPPPLSPRQTTPFTPAFVTCLAGPHVYV